MENRIQKMTRVLAVSLALIVSMSALSVASVPGVTDSEIKLGMSTSLSGPQAFQAGALDGFMTWVEEINAAGGIHGRQVTLISYDDQSSVQLAQSSTRRLIHQDEVFALVCGGGSSQALAVGELVRSAQIPFISCVSAHVDVVQPDDPYTFRIYANDIAQSKGLIDYVVNELNSTRPAIIYNSTDYGIGGYENMRQVLRDEYGLDFVASERYNVGDQTFRPLLLRIAQRRPDVLIVHGTANESGLVVRQAREYGLNATLVGGGGTPTPLFPEAAGRAAEGFPAVWVFPVMPEDEIGPVAAFKELQLKYVLTDGYPVGRPTLYDLTGYIAGKVVEEGLLRAGRDLTRESFLEALKSLENYDPAGIGFPITFSDDNEGTSETSIVVVNENLEWEVIRK